MYNENLRKEKETRIEAFSTFFISSNLIIETIKEIVEIEYCKFELWMLY